MYEPHNIKDMEHETTIRIKERIMRLQEQLQELCTLLDDAESQGLDLPEGQLPGLLDGVSTAIDEQLAYYKSVTVELSATKEVEAQELDNPDKVESEGLSEAEAEAPGQGREAVSPEDDAAEVAESAEYEEQGDAGVDPTPLRRMFTLNDRYRFRRELFGNLDAQMNEALEMLSAMRTIEEGADYLENDLCWDMSLPEVEEFMNILYRYYNSMRR